MTDKPMLLPCPFCGSEAEISNLGYSGPADCYDVLVRCDGCDAQGSSVVVDQSCGGDEGEAAVTAIAAWNRRADLPSGYRWVKDDEHV